MVWNPFTRAQHDRSRLRYASDLTDAEWRLLEPLMQPQSPLGRRRRTNMQDVMAGIFYVLQSGCAWHLIPKDFPPKSTVYRYFQYFIQEGLWDQIMGILHARLREQEGCDAQPTYAIIDSQSAKTGPNASKYIGFDAGKKVKGRKRYIVVDTLGLFSKLMCIQPPSRIVMGLRAYLSGSHIVFRSSLLYALMVDTPGLSHKKTAPWNSISSNGIKSSSKCCRSAGSLSVPLHGLVSIAEWPWITSATLQQLSHSCISL